MSKIDMKPSARAVINRLRQGPATTHDLCQPDVGGLRFGARLGELRTLGFDVDERRLKFPARGSLYTLTRDAERTDRFVAPVIEPVTVEPSGSLFDATGLAATSHYDRDAA